MEKLYNKIDFVNNTTPALNATNLNRMSKGLDDVDTRVVNLAANIMEAVPEIREDIETIQADMSAVEGYKDQAEESAEDAEAWAVGTRDGEPVPSTDPAYENSSKYWAEQSHISAGVTSFNGRAGSVTPQSGDYTAAMVGAIADTAKGVANGVAELNNSGKVPSSQLPDADYGMISDAWVVSHTYYVGDYCIEGGTLYKCNTQHTSTASNKPPYSYWTAVKVGEELTALNSGLMDYSEFEDLSSFTNHTGSLLTDRLPSGTPAKYKQVGNKVYLYIEFSSVQSTFSQYNSWDQWSIYWGGSSVGTLPPPTYPTQLCCIDDSGAFASASINQYISGYSKVLLLGNPSKCDLHDGEKCRIYGCYFV